MMKLKKNKKTYKRIKEKNYKYEKNTDTQIDATRGLP